MAGGGSDDGRLATDIDLYGVRGMAVDAAGNLYFAERFANLVRRIDAQTRTISTVAGNGGSGFTSDGVRATLTSISEPRSVAVDAAGNVYIADFGNSRVRKVDTTGIITTIAGGGDRTDGTLGDNGPAIDALLRGPHGLWLDGTTLYVTESGFEGQRLRKINLETNVITTVAGPQDGSEGFSGDGGAATAAKFSSPLAVITDAGKNIFIADAGNSAVRRIDAVTGVIETYAGRGMPADGVGDNGPALQAIVEFPTSLAFADGNLLVNSIQGVRRIDKTTRFITTIARPVPVSYGLVVDRNGNIYFADGDNGIFVLPPGATEATRYAGGGSFVGDGLVATAAILRTPLGLALDAGGNLYIADNSSARVRRVDKQTGVISTVAGTGGFFDNGESDNGAPATEVAIGAPLDVAFDPQGFLYIADGNNYRVRRVDLSTGISTFYAGGGTSTADGIPATSVNFVLPSGIAFDAAGNLFVTDFFANKVWRIDAQTRLATTFAGTGQEGFTGDGGPARNATLSRPRDAVVDADGTVYIADEGNGRIRKVAPDGTITTFAGGGSDQPPFGDGGPASAASFTLGQLAIDQARMQLILTDTNSSRVRKIDLRSGIITTVAGSGTFYFVDAGFSGDNGPATAAKLNMVFTNSGLALAPNGDIFVSDSLNNRVRFVPACLTTISAPTLVEPANGAVNTPTAPLLSWTKVEGAFRYDVLLDSTPIPFKEVASDLTETTFTPSNLQGGTRYTWQVVAKGDSFCSPQTLAVSSLNSFTTAAKCGVGSFDLISPADGADTQPSPLTLSWQAAPGAGTYDLYLGSVNPPPLRIAGITTTSVQVTLTEQQLFWFVVAHATCDATETSMSPTRRFTTAIFNSTCDEGLTGITLVQPGGGATGILTTTTLQWSIAGCASRPFEVYFGTSPNPPLLNTNVVSLTQQVTGLAPATTYFWRIVGVHALSGMPVSSATASFTTRACDAPGATSIVFAPQLVSAGTTYTIVWSPVSDLDASGGYLIERSTSPDFSTGVTTQVSSSTAASFIAETSDTFYHRVRAIPGCDPAKSGAISNVRNVQGVAADSNVIFTLQPPGVVTALGESLEEKRSTFALENLGSEAVQVILSKQEINGSQPFFTIADPAGGNPTFIRLEPRTPKMFEIQYRGPARDVPASYQGIIVANARNLAVIPYAFVNLKVGGGAAAAPEFVANGVPISYASFPPFPAETDDGGRPPLQVMVRNPGSTPMELAAEVGPDVWLTPDREWNATALPPGVSRTIRLSTSRTLAPEGSPLPRYTYFTVRTRDGASARLLVQDNDAIDLTAGRNVRLDLDTRSFIVPEVFTKTTAGIPMVTRLRLSNTGSDSVQADLFFTPSGADGFDSSAVRRAPVVIPPNDVVVLTDVVGQAFGVTGSASGQVEVRVPLERLGLIAVTAEAAAAREAIAAYKLPVVNRGAGARAGAPHVLFGVNTDASVTGALTLAETTGVGSTTVRAVLISSTGATLGQSTFEIPRYGYRRTDNIATLFGAAPVSGGRIELNVDSGGGAVIGVLTLAEGGRERSAVESQPVDDTTTSTASLFGALVVRGSQTVSIRTVIPIPPTPRSAGAAVPQRVLFALMAPPGRVATFVATFRGADGSTQTNREITIPAGTTRTVPDVLAEIFGLPAATSGSIFVEASPGGRVYAILQPAGAAARIPPGAFIPLRTNLSEALTSAVALSRRPLFYDGVEQSIDSTRGTRWQLLLNEVSGASGFVNVRLYEAGNRGLPIAEQTLFVGPFQQRTLDTVFADLGLDTSQRRKDRTNVQVVVTALSGSASVAATAVSIDNQTGETEIHPLMPSVGSATISVSLVAPIIPQQPTPPKRRRSARH